MTAKFKHRYTAANGIKSSCNVKLYSDDGENFVLFINTGDGISVTNASEQLATEIISKTGFNISDTRFFETYSEYDFVNLDEIKYIWEDKVAIRATWFPSDPEIREIFDLN